nr:flagellar basal body P-ring biosynthesis protein FlgA [Streptococcus thermophilus]
MDFLNLAPGYRRALALRRLTAALLLLAALLTAVTGRAANDPAVLVFTREVSPGEPLSAGDVELQRLPEAIVPESALNQATEVEGQIVASTASAGEVVTATRLLGPDLVSALVPGDRADYTMVPVKLAEPDIIPMLHHGDRVSVVTIDQAGQEGAARTIATNGLVLLAGGADDSPAGSVLLLLLHQDAEAVAAASLSSPLAVVLTGERG